MAQDWVETPLGAIHLVASESGLTKIGWGEVSRFGVSNEHLATAKDWLQAYFAGTDGKIPILDESGLTDFQSRILRALVEQIGFGQTISYAGLAAGAGHPRASRAVGSVMAMNPWPLLVPCHRVVRSDRVIGNYSGAGGPSTKIRLLKHEGHKFDDSGRIAN
tara:strand:- start:5458 stop:5943 length:486 start_codon:yes stop_codon:yes gene_type:complete